MSSDFTKVLVKDARIADLTDNLTYGVMKGGQSITSVQYKCPAPSTSSLTFNIQCPSETTIVDRSVMWRSTVILRLDITMINRQRLVRSIGTIPTQSISQYN